ncbi:hypothetical protein EDB51_101326 [Vibrio crassostreae]|nr:hypothetical protein EDB51_101326 [Vibrio crassostreae]
MGSEPLEIHANDLDLSTFDDKLTFFLPIGFEVSIRNS